MLRLLRGAGAAGLGAMAETVTLAPTDLTILRPMLRAGAHEILRYLDSIARSFMSDSSNAHQGFLRNRLRIELLPALERDYAPGLRRRLAALATEMRELDDYVARAAESELDSRLRGKPYRRPDGYSGSEWLRRIASGTRRGALAGVSCRANRKSPPSHAPPHRRLAPAMCWANLPAPRSTCPAAGAPSGATPRSSGSAPSDERRPPTAEPWRAAADGFDLPLGARASRRCRRRVSCFIRW